MLNVYIATVQDLITKQNSAVPDWMIRLSAELGAQAELEVVERVTPWGVYCIAAHPASTTQQLTATNIVVA